MSMTFDVTLKDMGRDSPVGFLTAFDGPPTLPVKLLNVNLSTVTTTADLIIGLGDPLKEIVQIDFQSSAAAWKHADLMVLNALLFAHYHVPVHTVMVLLRPQAAHSNVNGIIRYAPRPGRGSMDFGYEIVPLWERPVEELLTTDLGVTPLAMLGRLPGNLSLEEGLSVVAHRMVERLIQEAPPDRVRKLLTDALLLTGLRVRRDAAARIFRGVRAMEESDTYLAILDQGQERATREDILVVGGVRFGPPILDQGQERATREDILVVGGVRFGPPDESIRLQFSNITDLQRLKRMLFRTAKDARDWQDILDTP